MHWVAPSEEGTLTRTLEKRLWDAAEQAVPASHLARAGYHFARPEGLLGNIFLRFAEDPFATKRTKHQTIGKDADDDVNMHNTSEVLFRLCANTDPQRDSIFTKGPTDVLDHATFEIAMGTKLGIDATRKLAGEGFKRPWPPLVRMDEIIRKRIDSLLGSVRQ